MNAWSYLGVYVLFLLYVGAGPTLCRYNGGIECHWIGRFVIEGATLQ